MSDTAQAQRGIRSLSLTRCICCRTQAFNGLLKTLEEPPAHVKFVFATTEIRKVPVTVLSRCQRFDLRRLTIEETLQLLNKVCAAEGTSFQDESLALIARAAEGSARDALSLLDRALAHGTEAMLRTGRMQTQCDKCSGLRIAAGFLICLI